MLRTYDPEFRRRVLGLVRAGRPVRVVAAELGLAEATVYRWKAQDLIDRGVKPGTTTSERGELAAARQRIKELETELALVKQAAALFEEGVRPKATYPVIARAGQPGLLGQAVLPDSWCGRLGVLHVAAPPALTPPIPLRLADRAGAAIHADSRGTYGWRRVNAELVYGHGVVVNRKTVRKIMRLHGLHGLPGPRRGFRNKANIATTADLVERRFDRPAPDQLGDRHHRASHPGGQAVLLCGAGGVLPSSGGLVHRQPPGHPAGHQRLGHGHHQPPATTGSDGDP
jgi:putative transposase